MSITYVSKVTQYEISLKSITQFSSFARGHRTDGHGEGNMCIFLYFHNEVPKNVREFCMNDYEQM